MSSWYAPPVSTPNRHALPASVTLEKHSDVLDCFNVINDTGERCIPSVNDTRRVFLVPVTFMHALPVSRTPVKHTLPVSKKLARHALLVALILAKNNPKSEYKPRYCVVIGKA
jgi:hypothetical protein